MESRCWLLLILKAELLPVARVGDLLDECEQLGKILAKSLVTTKGKPRDDPRQEDPTPKDEPHT